MLLFFITVLLLASPAPAKIYERCELARELSTRLQLPLQSVSTWVCIAYHESRFDTSAVGSLNWDGSQDHGLLQISELYWCGKDGPGGACYIPCSKLRDEDLEDDLSCAMKIHEEHTRLSGDGYNAWAVYHVHCDGINVKKYTVGCDEKSSGSEYLKYFNPIMSVNESLILNDTQANYYIPFTTLFDIDKLLPITTARTPSSSQFTTESIPKSTSSYADLVELPIKIFIPELTTKRNLFYTTPTTTTFTYTDTTISPLTTSFYSTSDYESKYKYPNLNYLTSSPKSIISLHQKDLTTKSYSQYSTSISSPEITDKISETLVQNKHISTTIRPARLTIQTQKNPSRDTQFTQKTYNLSTRLKNTYNNFHPIRNSINSISYKIPLVTESTSRKPSFEYTTKPTRSPSLFTYKALSTVNIENKISTIELNNSTTFNTKKTSKDNRYPNTFTIPRSVFQTTSKPSFVTSAPFKYSTTKPTFISAFTSTINNNDKTNTETIKGSSKNLFWINTKRNYTSFDANNIFRYY